LTGAVPPVDETVMKSLLFGLGVALSAPLAAQTQMCYQADWCQPAEPFRIVGNIHYVGTAGLSAFLISDPRGHVLIDGGLPQSAPLIAANIRKLGFRVEDVRYLLINHAHFDHAGGLAELKRLSGATLVAATAVSWRSGELA
jgi:metallo-beta-lactamase class B